MMARGRRSQGEQLGGHDSSQARDGGGLRWGKTDGLGMFWRWHCPYLLMNETERAKGKRNQKELLVLFKHRNRRATYWPCWNY